MKYLIPLITALALMATAFAKPLPAPKASTYVNDYTGVLTDAAVRDLNFQIAGMEQRTYVQVAVLIVNSTNSQTIEAFANQIGKSWKIGKAKNGIVYIADIAHHLQRLEIADSIRSVLSDSTCAQLLLLTHPFFKQKNYAGGIVQLLAAIHNKLPVYNTSSVTANVEAEAVSLSTAPLSEYNYKNEYLSSLCLNALLGFLLILALLFLFWRNRRGTATTYESQANSYSSGSSSGIGNYGGGFFSGFFFRGLFSNSRGTSNDQDSNSSSWSSNDSDSSLFSSSSSSSDFSSDSSSDSGSSDSSGDSGFSGGGASDSW